MPSLAQGVGERLAQRPGLAGQHVRSALDENHLAAKPTNGLRHLDADRPAAEHEQPAGTAFMPVTSRFVQMPSRPRRPGTGGMIGSEPVATTTCSAV